MLPLYSLSIDSDGIPVLQTDVHSSFRTSDGKSIQDIQKLPYAVNSAGRYSRIQTITDTHKNKYIVKHLKYHYNVDRALNEVQNLMVFLGNPYVVQVLGAEIYSTTAFIIFAYIPGKTFANWIRSSPPPSHDERTQRYREIETAIQSIHDIGYAHLDIQPANIWIPDDLHTPAFLLDLGSAHPIGSERKEITGTPGYYPAFENLTLANTRINKYGLEKVLQLDPAATKRSRRRTRRRRRI
jgi:serine/threonine protein kinase